jgi:class 3 adenylate cyclase
MSDIHGYTRLSEMVTDEMACPFRFKFTDHSQEIVTRYGGIFEDQGDGYKVFFRGLDPPWGYRNARGLFLARKHSAF